ncbi:MAG: hypothetical protein Q9188_006155 [Gyalolechia gomerana]
MADLFGCIGVAETGLRLGLAIEKIVQALRSALDELLALSNKVCDLRLTSNGVRQAMTASGIQEWPGVELLLFQASIRFDQVGKIVRKLGQSSPYGTIWNPNTWDRCQDFHLAKRAIATFGTLESHFQQSPFTAEREESHRVAKAAESGQKLTTNRMAIDVQELLLQTAQIHSSHTGSLEKHRECSEDLTRRVSLTMEELRTTQEETKALLEALLQAVPKMAFQDPSSSAAGKTNPTQPRPAEKVDMDMQYYHPQPAYALGKSPELAPVAIPISSDMSDQTSCWSDCACLCHRRSNFKSPTVSKKISGQLFLG